LRQIPEAIIDAIESIHLPSMPQVLLRFLTLAEDERADSSQLSAVVRQDPALCARILTVANSAALRRGAEIKTIEQCLNTLGTRLVRTLASCLAIQSTFARSDGEQDYDYSGFWCHSLRVAELARAIAIKVGYPELEEAYLAGLLHDTGQLILQGGLTERYAALLACSVDEEALHDLENSVLGSDHATIGAWLADQWHSSSFMADAILFHHYPAKNIITADLLSRIVWSAHSICCSFEKLDSTTEETSSQPAPFESILGLELATITSLAQQAFQRVTMLAEAFAIIETAERRTIPHASISFESDQAPPNEQAAAWSQIEDVVRNMALMQTLQQDLSALSNETEILVAVRECARILFGLGRIYFLLIRPDDNILSGPDMAGQCERLHGLQISLDDGHSLAGKAARGDRPCSTFDRETPVSLVDVQIARALGSKGVLYLPMRTREQRIGIMAFGLNEPQLTAIQHLLGRMTSFAGLAAAGLESWRKTKERENKLQAELISQFDLQARKVIHEAANPLSIIKNYLQIISQRNSADNSLLPVLDILREEIDRVVQIVHRFNTVAVSTPPEDTFDINAVIEGMLALYAESLFTSRGISVEKNLSPAVQPVSGDRDCFKQILFNIWKNASEAMPNGGFFTISTHDNLIKGSHICSEIRMSDSGPGLPEDIIQRLFQPLKFNCRPGTSGIGLSLVAELVNRLGGQIVCQSSAELGTRFSILLQKSEVGKK